MKVCARVAIALSISVVLQVMTQLVASTLLCLLYSQPLHTSQFTNPQEPSAVMWPNAVLWLGCTLQCSRTAGCKANPQAPSLLCRSGCGQMKLGHTHSLMSTKSDVRGQTQGPISRVILRIVRVWYPRSDTQGLIPSVDTQEGGGMCYAHSVRLTETNKWQYNINWKEFQMGVGQAWDDRALVSGSWLSGEKANIRIASHDDCLCICWNITVMPIQLHI